MRLINSSVEILEQEPGMMGMLQHIERAGRTCYKSEDKITEDSTPKFVDMLIKRGHTACLEQGTVYLYSLNSTDALKKYANNPYSRYKSVYSHKEVCQSDVDYYNHEYVTTNYRVLYENDWLDDIKYICEPTIHHPRRFTARFICDRGVSHELVRHRVFSFAQESTRYCNYGKDRFGNELTFIIPTWSDLQEGQYQIKWNGLIGEEPTVRAERNSFRLFWSLAVAERDYLKSLETGLTPQQARQVLPNALKTEVVMTGFIWDWQYFFNLRCAQDAHPDMRKLAQDLFEQFCHREYIHTEG